MELYGKLIMNDDGEFELENEETNSIINISQILDDIFSSQLKPQMYIKIIKKGRLLYEEEGGLFLHTDDQKVESYFVCGNNLSKLLFYNTDEYIELIIRRRKYNNDNKS